VRAAGRGSSLDGKSRTEFSRRQRPRRGIAHGNEKEDDVAFDVEAFHREAFDRQALDREAEHRQALDRQAQHRQALDGEALDREAEHRQALDRQAEHREALDRQADDRQADHGPPRDREAVDGAPPHVAAVGSRDSELGRMDDRPGEPLARTASVQGRE
jgi:hypothetical protein